MKDKNLERLLDEIKTEDPVERLTPAEIEFFNLLRYWEDRNYLIYTDYIIKYINVLRGLYEAD